MHCTDVHPPPVCCAGTCCDIRSTTSCGTQCCVLATQLCNFITKTCADRVNLACPAQWCPLAPGGPVCCSSQSPPAGYTFQCQGSMGCQLVQTTSPQTVCGGVVCAPGTTCVGGACQCVDCLRRGVAADSDNAIVDWPHGNATD